jgi:glyoxylase-like metal-dependent hydrolase (beta-lactamase superfamily II)
MPVVTVPRVTIGAATAILLNDGFWWDDGGAMFGVVPKDLWAREKPADDANRIHMSLVCPLIVADGEVILVDTGIGDRLGERERRFYRPERGAGLVGCLRACGLEPEDVTMVVLSHLHFDHCGGVMSRTATGGFALTYPRARHVIQRREWDAALSPSNTREAAAYRHAPECLSLLAGRHLALVDGSTGLTASVRVVTTGGHTPAHQCVVAENAGAGFVHLADLAPTVPHLRPAWTAAYDLDPLESLAAKTRVITQAIAAAWWVSFDHDDRIAVARLSGDPARPTIREELATPTPPGAASAPPPAVA